MYKLSDLIKELEKEKETYGDLYIKEYKVVNEEHGYSMTTNSKHRKYNCGRAKKATLKEFTEMVKKQRGAI